MDGASQAGGRAFLHYLSLENTLTDTYSSIFQDPKFSQIDNKA